MWAWNVCIVTSLLYLQNEQEPWPKKTNLSSSSASDHWLSRQIPTASEVYPLQISLCSLTSHGFPTSNTWSWCPGSSQTWHADTPDSNHSPDCSGSWNKEFARIANSIWLKYMVLPPSSDSMSTPKHIWLNERLKLEPPQTLFSSFSTSSRSSLFSPSSCSSHLFQHE